jgi:7-cyano-7-deazaguanine synthase
VKRVCVLASGGVDSAVLLGERLSRGDEVFPLYVRCGLRWEEAELLWLRRYLRALSRRRWPGKLRPLTVGSAPVSPLLRRHWSLNGRRVPSAKASWDSVYLPGRNLLLLTQAGMFCASRGISSVSLAVLEGNPFRDATSGFRRHMEGVLREALGRRIRVEAPYARLSKARVIRRVPGLPLHLTFSCLKPKDGAPCGRCSKCAERWGGESA